eukprot:CAMPEP_0169164340 /NCGR_PEP_ID=MMETSP1015-20121227/58789_1 /TAXON_ID=342587 /ORGANISM="Karlodinium micrum, Strain CCMP2283" /LENGTH=65 /DNA_ID=CAMNT_0009236783 /DNA_START=551 /DNA_END=748 /DNA_ORIENTATION=-
MTKSKCAFSMLKLYCQPKNSWAGAELNKEVHAGACNFHALTTGCPNLRVRRLGIPIHLPKLDVEA